MAERRMIAKTIVSSDAFLDMPLSAQALYFHLNQEADDDGFVGSPYAVLRMCGAAKDDLNILLAKRFILGFQSGVIVIKHWLINNYIQKDRYRPTTYIEERKTLTFDDKKSYVEIEKSAVYTDCIQNGYKMDTQVRIGKDSINTLSITARAYARERGQGGIGEYENVYLTAEDVQDILDGRDRAGADKGVFAEYVDKLSYHIQRYGKDRDSDHHAILVKWMTQDGVYEGA